MRSRLAAMVAVVLATLAAQPPAERDDVILRGGRVLDGTGAPPANADVAIRAGRITAIGDLSSHTAARVIDVRGLTVTPGFIDPHSHSSGGLARDLNKAEPLLAQGITTVVLNPDGGGPVDLVAQRATLEQRHTGVNVALFVPHGSIRQHVLAMSDRDPTAAELAQMVDLVRAGMRAGGIGLSSGLYYAPGSYSKTEEVIAMARAAGEAGGVYQSHIRDEGDYNVGVVASVDEVIRIAEEGHLPGIVTHMKALGRGSWGLSKTMTEHIDAARTRGVAVWADQYPYEASGTSITGALIPRWAQVGGNDALQKRISGPERPRLLGEVKANIERRGGPDTLVISRYAPDPELEGRSLAFLAAGRKKSPEEIALDLLANGGAGLVSFNMTENDIDLIMRQPYTMTSTDGDLVPMGQGKPHPRAYGTFPRKLRVFVRERGVIDLPAAIRSMTSLTATVFGMKDRGVLRPGAWADIVVFDPAKITDKATYQDPHQLSEGIVYALVNGELVRDNNKFTSALPGKFVGPERR
jgi:N-acyl-D-amino-acid deacylase